MLQMLATHCTATVRCVSAKTVVLRGIWRTCVRGSEDVTTVDAHNEASLRKAYSVNDTGKSDDARTNYYTKIVEEVVEKVDERFAI